MTKSDVNDDRDLVRDALAGARSLGRGLGRGIGRSAGGRSRQRRSTAAGAQAPATGYSSAHPDELDPQPVGEVLSRYVSDRGWERPLAEARVFVDWPSIVGTDVAAHCRPTALESGELKVTAESTAWATQLRLLTSTILARIAAELGPDVVARVHITGPTGPSWKHGGRSVPGARGPRDTYG